MGITIHGIAAIAKVDSSTVSRALRGDPRVKAPTRARIAEIARANGYIANRTAKALAEGRTSTICLVGPMHTIGLGEYAVAANDYLEPFGYSLILMIHNDTPGQLANCRARLAQKICDGAIFASPPEILTRNPGVPFLCIDQRPLNRSVPVVTNDAEKSIRLLFEELTPPDGVFIGFGSGNSVALRRRECAEKLLKERGIPYTEELSDLEAFLRRTGPRNFAVFADSPGCGEKRIPEILKRFPGIRCEGAMFDAWNFRTPECYDRICLCIQDFAEAGRRAAEYLLTVLNGRPPRRREIFISPLKISEPAIIR